jgi:hypothetical protein
MEVLAKLFRDPFDYENDTYVPLILTNELKSKLDHAINRVSFDGSDPSECQISSCACTPAHSFWSWGIHYAEINFDIFKWMVEELDCFPIKTNENIRYMFLNAFDILLYNDGHEHNTGMYDRIRKLSLYIFNWFEKEIPIEFISHIIDTHEKKYNFLERSLSTYINGLEYSNYILNLHEKYNIKIFDKAQKRIFLLSLNYYDDLLYKRILPMIDKKNYPNLKHIAKILYLYADRKSIESINHVTNNINFLLNLNNDININESFLIQINSGGKKLHNITDFLIHYGWNYPNSPMMKIFPSDLPPPINMKFSEYDISETNSYYNIFNKYKYTKDPNIYPEIIQEFYEFKISHPDITMNGYSTVWCDLPGFCELFNIKSYE